jgi:tetratricopeptide (TPR) repeat protein
MKDFFISYNKADKKWAEWIAWTLEESGYTVVFQVWDFRPGQNFVLRMQEAAIGTEKTIAVLSEDYLNAEFTQPEWADAFKRDPQGKQRILIPVRVKECNPPGLLSPTIYIDLLGRSSDDARRELLEGVGKDRAKPNKAPMFPGDATTTLSPTNRVMPNPVPYPGTANVNSGSPTTNILSNLPTGIPFFTGREEVLKELEQTLKSTGATALTQRQAISGLGGIGKTQTAIEYARRHRNEYRALLWAVAESKESLISDFVAIATVLDLAEAKVQDQNFVVKAVKMWLETNGGWLLILDNADEPGVIDEFLPEEGDGHLLLTSRAQVFDALGILNPVELQEMSPDDARGFLLKRTGRHNLEKGEGEAVEQLAAELDYLPLALEQAGAYIKELRSSFQDYLTSYHERGLELLERGHTTGKYRKSIRTTWSLNFQQVEQTSKASADLLRVSAFLNPDRIPTDLFQRGAIHLGPDLASTLSYVDADPLVLDEVLQPLIQYSLIHRDRVSRTYNIHRLVQAVLRDGMDELTRRQWVERVVKAMASIFPNVDAIAAADSYNVERLLPHAQACAELVLVWDLQFPEASHLLNLTGRYLHWHGRLRETERLYNRAMSVRKESLGLDHLDVATSLHNMGWLYHDQGNYANARPLLTQSLATREELLGPDHPDVATTLALLGVVSEGLGHYREAYRLVLRSLEIREKAFGPSGADVADSLSLLVNLYLREGRYSDAERVVLRSLGIRENSSNLRSRQSAEIAHNLNSLAIIYDAQGKRTEAEAFYLRALSMREERFGSRHPRLAGVLANLARLYVEQGRYQEADRILARSLTIREMGLGIDHPEVALSLDQFAYSYRRQSRYSEAELPALRSLAVRERSLGPDHPDVALSLISLGRLYRDWRKFAKGEELLRRAIPILKKTFGLESMNTANALFLHAELLKGMNRKGEAQKLEGQARKIQGKLRRRPNHGAS